MQKLIGLGKLTTSLPSKKRAIPTSSITQEVTPNILPSNLDTPLLGVDFDLQSEFVSPSQEVGIPVDWKDKELISSKAIRMKRELPVLEITDITYVMMSHEELEKAAVYEVENKNDSGLYSVNDPRGGTVDLHHLCNTCQRDNLECPGHLGIIKLNEPILHPLVIREIYYILTSVCGSCGGLLLSPEYIDKKIMNLPGPARLKEIAKASEGIACRNNINSCETGVTSCVPNPKYIHDKEFGIISYTREKKDTSPKNQMTTSEIEKIFECIEPEDAKVLGFEGESHPLRFIMKSVPVIPLCARAPVVIDGMIKADHITEVYQQIVSLNLKLVTAKLEEKGGLVREMFRKIKGVMDNSDKKTTLRQNKPVLSILERIQGKDALIRDSLMGKRVNYSARTVIGPDPSLKFGQIRVPRVMAPFLTQPETVTPENIGKLTNLLRTGKITHITPVGGRLAEKRFQVNEKHRKEHQLFLGDKVDRWLENGDFVVADRQPTLHKQGIMGYEVVLGDSLTIGLHLGYTPQHNADFDGDEMTIHAPQSEDARREVAGLMAATCNIMNAQTNSNIAAVVFDALTASYLLSLPETTVDKDVFMNILAFMENKTSLDTLDQRLEKHNISKYVKVGNEERATGRALLSALFPEDFYYERRSDGNQDPTIIRNGVLISGVLDKSIIGAASGSIIQALYKDYGMPRTIDFLTDIYRAAKTYMDSHGFSVGLDDCFLQGEDPQKTINYEVERASLLVKSMGVKLLDPLEEERREAQIKAYLDTAKNFGSTISKKNLKPDNSFNIMASSGAKGSTRNIAQITGILGQQFVVGQRMPEVISGRTRALAYFPENDLDPAARGFVVNSYLTGLTPAEYIFGMVGARVGLTDTAIKTSQTGSIHHRIVKALEDIKVVDDGSVRNTAEVVFQFAYGEDGFDASMLESVKTKSGVFTSFINIKRAASKINQKYGF